MANPLAHFLHCCDVISGKCPKIKSDRLQKFCDELELLCKFDTVSSKENKVQRTTWTGGLKPLVSCNDVHGVYMNSTPHEHLKMLKTFYDFEMMRWDIMQRKVLLNQKFRKAVEKTMGETSGHIQGKAFSTYLGGTENWTQISRKFSSPATPIETEFLPPKKMSKIEELSTNQDPWKAFFILSKIAKQMKNLLKKNKEDMNEVNLIQKQVKAIEVNKTVAKTIINIQSRSTEKLPEIKKPAIKTVTLTRNQSLPRQTKASDLRMSWTRKSYPNLVTIPNELPRKWSHERPKHKPDGRSTLTKLFYLPKISTTRPRRTNVKDFLPYLLN